MNQHCCVCYCYLEHSCAELVGSGCNKTWVRRNAKGLEDVLFSIGGLTLTAVSTLNPPLPTYVSVLHDLQDALESFLQGSAVRQLREAISSEEETLSTRLLKNVKNFLGELLAATGSRCILTT